MSLIARALPAALTISLAIGALAAPPRVVRVTPADGAAHVPPGAATITVVFDQPMGPGMSVIGGGPTFPALRGQPSWRDTKTFSLPVTLEPGRYYRFGINGSPRQRNFRSVQGEPVRPRVVEFVTAGGAVDAAANTKAIAALRDALARQYSYRALRGLDQRPLRLREETLRGAAPTAFALLVARDLGRLRDRHVWVDAPGGLRLASHRVATAANGSVPAVARLLRGWKQHGPNLGEARTAEGVGYLVIASLSDDSAERAATIVDAAADVRGWIVDLRFDSGGDERRAQAFASRFATARVVYARHRTLRDGELGPWVDRVLAPAPTARRRPLAALIGPVTMSSAEAFALMVRAVGGRLFGAATAGSSGNPRAHDLGNGVTVYLPSWIAADATGATLEGRGVAPDEAVPYVAADRRAGRDPVLAAARRWIAAQRGD